MKKNKIKLRNISLYIALLMVLSSCTEEIQLTSIDGLAFENMLIIEAVMTNEFKTHSIQLSRTLPLDSVHSVSETGAHVFIESSTSEIFHFTEIGDGLYTSDAPFACQPTVQYSLHISTKDGETYESMPEKMEGINPLDTVYAVKDYDANNKAGIGIYAESSSDNQDAKYYKFTYEETYKIIAPHYSKFALNIVSRSHPFLVERYYQNENREVCYNTVKSIDIIQSETNSLRENKVLKRIRFIDGFNFILAHRYSILVEQQVQSFNAYTYYKTLKKVATSDNIFSQNQPGYVQGNIYSIGEKEKKAIGFFEVNAVSKKRIFFNPLEIQPDNFINTRADCNVLAPYQNEPQNSQYSPLISMLDQGYLFYARNTKPSFNFPGPYKITRKSCGDCRENGSIIKPLFWID